MKSKSSAQRKEEVPGMEGEIEATVPKEKKKYGYGRRN